jgi:hypothetical protein
MEDVQDGNLRVRYNFATRASREGCQPALVPPLYPSLSSSARRDPVSTAIDPVVALSPLICFEETFQN